MRWFQYREPGTYDARVTLECGLCRFDPSDTRWIPFLRQDWKFRTTSLRSMVEHYRNDHAENFVSVEKLLTQTGLWRYEWLMTHPNPAPLMQYGSLRRQDSFYRGGLTS